MKKVLLATTALALSAGVAYAEVSFSGNARMGLTFTGKQDGKAAVAGSITAAEIDALAAAAEAAGMLGEGDEFDIDSLATALGEPDENGTFATSTEVMASVMAARAMLAQQIDIIKAAAAAAQDGSEVAGAALAELEAQLAVVDQAIAAASGTAAVAATDSTVKLEKRMTVTMSGSVETTSGLTLGASMNLRANEGSAAVTSGARVSLATGGVEVAVGNIYGAIDSMPGVYGASAGLTGLGWGGVLANTAANGSWAWDSYSSSGNGSEGLEVIYSGGSVTAHLSYSDSDLGSAANRTAAYVSYAMGDWTVAAGMQDSADNDEDKTLVTVGGKVGDFGVGIGYADNGGETKLALNGSATFGATTVSAYVASEESADHNPMGVGISHDLGGASLVGGVAKTATGVTRADIGVSFGF
jgi:outer membrane protein OmpU